VSEDAHAQMRAEKMGGMFWSRLGSLRSLVCRGCASGKYHLLVTLDFSLCTAYGRVNCYITR
jgi:hypothetical protein